MGKDINGVIDRLADIDSASEKIMKDTQKAKTDYANYIKKQKDEFDKALQADIDKEVQQFKETVDAENKEKINECRKECDNKLSELNKIVSEKSSEWAEDIFNRIIKE